MTTAELADELRPDMCVVCGEPIDLLLSVFIARSGDGYILAHAKCEGGLRQYQAQRRDACLDLAKRIEAGDG